MVKNVRYASALAAIVMLSATWPAIADRRPGDRPASKAEGGAATGGEGRASGGVGVDPIRPPEGQGSTRVGENPGSGGTKDGGSHAGGDGVGGGSGAGGGGGVGGGTGGGHAQGSPAPVAGLGFGALLALGIGYRFLRRRVQA